jgi:hypothetical protein
VAAAAPEAGTDVHAVEAAEQPLLGVLGPEMGRSSPTCTASTGSTSGSGKHRPGADVEGADAVVVGVGVPPRTELAEAAGLDVDNGVLVDARLAPATPTSTPSATSPTTTTRARPPDPGRALGHRPQPAGAGRRGDPGRHAPYERLPYFFSDQYDLGMEYVGHATRDDTPASSSAATSEARVRGVLARRPGPDPGRHERQRVGRPRRGAAPDHQPTVVDVDKLSDPNTPLSDVGR